MPRPKNNESPDLTKRASLTVAMIERIACPQGKQQAFLRDSEVPGLLVRVTSAGAKSFVFESKFNRQTIRKTLGDVRTWRIEQARIEARRLAVLLDSGQDPRELERARQEAQLQAKKIAEADTLSVGDVWPLYLANGRPKRKDAWKPRYRADLEAMALPGGVPKKRGMGMTRPGPLYPLMSLPLVEVTEDQLQSWYEREAKSGKHQAARALMMFRGFLRWCSTRPEYRELINRSAGSAPAIMEVLPSNVRRTDALEAAQVASWWCATEQLTNQVAKTYLQALLLTGARREEMASLTWDQVDLHWSRLTLADKVDFTRTIPLTPYMAEVLYRLPRTGKYVFAGTGKAGRIVDARGSHNKVLRAAKIDHLTFHGLRRSFSLLAEAAGAPAGAIAQIMGHKPSGTAEGYRPRSLDALRPYQQKIESHIVHLAKITNNPVSIIGNV